MRTSHTIQESRRILYEERSRGRSIGFVPTMGYLHEGHLSLVDIAKNHTSFVVMSIFVNPLQFGPKEDYREYPRAAERDAERAASRGVGLLFSPAVEEMYPEENLTFVEVKTITEGLCGRSRPGHFTGVMTVVTKLFNIIEPDVAVFGQKDAQQVIAVQRLVRDLNFHCTVITGPTVREEDGLAMSSRNRYLSPDERRSAPLIHQSLLTAKALVARGERDVGTIVREMEQVLARGPGIRVDYVSITDTQLLQACDRVDGEVLVAVAAFVGKTRLIDNIIVAG